MKASVILLGAASLLVACDIQNVGRAPALTTIGQPEDDAPAILTAERASLAVPPPEPARYAYQQASLWSTTPSGLLGDRRAKNLGDILTVTIEIDDKAEMKNSSKRSRDGSESAEVGGFFGVGNVLPPGLMKLNPNVEMGAQSDYSGDGSVKRNEKLRLRIAATVVQVLPNGQLVIQGDQEVRVNFELRDLQIVGIVRPEDISRYNEIPYDRIAGARISYGGRGQISNVQQPRYGQQIVDQVMPY